MMEELSDCCFALLVTTTSSKRHEKGGRGIEKEGETGLEKGKENQKGGNKQVCTNMAFCFVGGIGKFPMPSSGPARCHRFCESCRRMTCGLMTTAQLPAGSASEETTVEDVATTTGEAVFDIRCVDTPSS